MTQSISPARNTRPEYALLLALLGLGLHLLAAAAGLGTPRGELSDPDGYMRLVRTAQLVETGGWFDDTIQRSNAPDGESLHWTRPLDVLLIAGAAPLAVFTGWERALWLWGVALSPVLLAAAAVVLALGLGLRREEHGLLAVLLVMCQPALMQMCAAARPDHHSLLVFCAVLTAVLARRAMLPRFPAGQAFFAGLAGACGVWVSVEFLPVAAWAGAGVAACGILRGTAAMDRTRHMAWGAAAGLAAAVLIEHPPSRWNHGLPDQIGLHHAAAALAAGAALEAAFRVQQRLGLERAGRLLLHASAALPALAVTAWAWPSLVEEPFGYLPAELRRNWLDHVGDLQPLGSLADPPVMALFIWLFPLPLLGGWALACALRSHQAGAALPRSLVSWWWITGGLAFTILAWTCFRWTAYAQVFLLAPLLLAALRFRRACRPGPSLPVLPAVLLRTSGTLLFACGFLAFTPWSTMLKKPPESAAVPAQPAAEPGAFRPPARLAEAATWVNTRPEWDNAIVLAPLDDGPEWLYRTRVRVIASPYHRNIRGILDSHQAMARQTPEEAKAWLDERGVDFIAWQARPGADQFWTVGASPDAFFPRLLRGEIPPWLEPVPLPPQLEGRFHAWRVQRPSPPTSGTVYLRP